MTPLAIELDSDAGQLAIHWPDARVQKLDIALPRRSCRCADCLSASRAGAPPLPARALQISRIVPAGSYGVQLAFSDGHERGIYPWSYLRSL